MLSTPKVYLIKRSVKVKSRARPTQYWVLRWPSSAAKLQSESIGRVGKMTRAEAEALRQQKVIDLAGGKVLRDRPRKLTLAQFVEEHEEAVKTKVSGATLTEYATAAEHVMKALGDDVLIERIGPAEIGRIEAYLFGRKRSKATVNKTLRAMRAMFNRAVKWGRIARNPFSGWELPESGAKEARIFTRHEIDLMVSAAPTLWWETFVRLAGDTGLRKMELLHLRWSDVDLQDETVSVMARGSGAFRAHGEEYPIIAWAVKGRASTRTVPLSVEAHAILRRRKVAAGGSAYVFLDLPRLDHLRRHIEADGALPAHFELRPNLLRDFRVIQGNARKLLAKAKRAKLDDVPWSIGCIHDLRRSWCTHLAASVPMHVLKEYAGHADIGTTAKHYLKTSEADAAKVRRALGAA